MSAKKLTIQSVFIAIAFIATTFVVDQACAQRRPIRIGGSNGVIFGGGMGFKMGGPNGVHFGGGQGAKFGPSEFGMHFGNGQGARFGGQDFGMQFGGGQGARFGTPQYGMQFGNGEGARFGQQGNPIMQFGGGQGAQMGPAQIGGRNREFGQPGAFNPNGQAVVAPGNAPLSNVSVSPTPTMTAPTVVGSTINIRYPAAAKEKLDYSLNGSSFSFAPGGNTKLRNDRDWNLSFKTGKGLNKRQYTRLQPGNYVIRQSNTGWQLFREKLQPAPVAKPPKSVESGKDAIKASTKLNGARSVLENKNNGNN